MDSLVHSGMDNFITGPQSDETIPPEFEGDDLDEICELDGPEFDEDHVYYNPRDPMFNRYDENDDSFDPPFYPF